MGLLVEIRGIKLFSGNQIVHLKSSQMTLPAHRTRVR